MTEFPKWFHCHYWLILALPVLLAACAAPAPPHQGEEEGQTTIHVTSNGWHTGIVLAKADIPDGLLPELGDYPAAKYFEFGWGDAKFYPSKEATIGMTMQAALLPTPAVMHVVALWTSPKRYFPEAEIIALSLGQARFRKLLAFIDNSFKRSGAARVEASAQGLYADSGFYPATGRFHLLNTCNTWTARALRAAGFKIKSTGTAHAEALMQQVRRLAHVAFN